VPRSPWYTGPTLFEQLDSTDVPPRDPLAPFRMAVIDKFKDLGTVVMGKSESGAVRKGDTLLLMPNRCVYDYLGSVMPLVIGGSQVGSWQRCRVHACGLGGALRIPAKHAFLRRRRHWQTSAGQRWTINNLVAAAQKT
jgi:hypothetical protein